MGDREFAAQIAASLTREQRDAGLMAMRDTFTMLEVWTALGNAGVEYWSLAGAWGLVWEQQEAGKIRCSDVRLGQWEVARTHVVAVLDDTAEIAPLTVSN